MKIKHFKNYNDFLYLSIKIKKKRYNIILMDESSLILKDDKYTNLIFKEVGDYNAINILHYESYFV